MHDGFSSTSYPVDMHDLPGEKDQQVTLAKEQARYEFKRNLGKKVKETCQPTTDAGENNQALARRTAQRQRRAALSAAKQAESAGTTQAAQP